MYFILVFPLYQDPPLQPNYSQSACLCWITIKQPNDSSEELYTNDAIEIQLSDLFVAEAELKWGVSGGQTSSQWLYANSQKTIKWMTQNSQHVCVCTCMCATVTETHPSISMVLHKPLLWWYWKNEQARATDSGSHPSCQGERVCASGIPDTLSVFSFSLSSEPLILYHGFLSVQQIKTIFWLEAPRCMQLTIGIKSYSPNWNSSDFKQQQSQQFGYLINQLSDILACWNTSTIAGSFCWPPHLHTIGNIEGVTREVETAQRGVSATINMFLCLRINVFVLWRHIKI